jgi:hypothetical protein
LIVIIIILLIEVHPPGITAGKENLSLLIRGSWGVVGFAAAIGVASAGVVQVAKQLSGIRGYFQRSWVKEWMEDRVSNGLLWNRWIADHAELVTGGTAAATAEGSLATLAEKIAKVQRERAASELEEALLGGLSRREFTKVFDLSTEQLCAQVSIAADLAMNRPNEFSELLLALTGPAGLKQIDALTSPANVLPDGEITREPPPESTEGEPGEDNEENTARALAAQVAYPLVAQGVRAGVDLLQISLGQRWRRGVQWSAVVVSGSLGAMGAFLLREPLAAQILLGVTALILGGFFAWLARDLVAIIERARR